MLMDVSQFTYFLAALQFLTGEFDKVGDLTFTAHSLLMLVLSCAVGTGLYELEPATTVVVFL